MWISAAAGGHIQAVGTDTAGRRQYRYHDLWREQRDRERHDRVLAFGAALPRLRTVVLGHLEGRTLSRDRVLAAAIGLVDLGFFRPGGDEYAVENGSYGLATIRRDHVTWRRGELVFDYIGKSAQHREQAVADERARHHDRTGPGPAGPAERVRGAGHAGRGRGGGAPAAGRLLAGGWLPSQGGWLPGRA